MQSEKRQAAGRTRWTGTWLSGARSAGADLGDPGQRLGLPATGSGAVAGYGRRLLGLFIDWGISLLISSALTRAFDWDPSQRSLVTLGIFALQAWLLTGLLGTTIGKLVTGVRVVRLDGKPVGLLWSAVRTVLLVLVVPALLWDRDHRGLHDQAAKTIVLNA